MSSLHHSKIESNHIDPDDGNSWLCTACNLPIFATPFTGGGTTALLHDHCADLPEILKNSELHPQKPLLLADNNSSATCSECSEKCGSKLYSCPDSDCGLVLDVACALPIKVLHRSHRHRLMAVRGSSFHICGICGEKHEGAAVEESRSYFCNVCGFWIHSDCATSAHVIVHDRHVHPLVLYYDVDAAFGARAPWNLHFYESSVCAICGINVGDTVFAVYFCNDCSRCVLHISCATSDRRAYKSVLFREAEFATLVRLPIPDEHESIVRYVKDVGRGNLPSNNEIEFHHQQLVGDEHHRFIFQHHSSTTKSDEDEDEDEDDRRVCDACLKTIKSSDPFYSCSVCPNLLLHDFCYRIIPPVLIDYPTYLRRHHFRMYTLDQIKNTILRYYQSFEVYLRYQFYFFDLVALGDIMPAVVTHDEHATAHFLHLSDRLSRDCCDCCGRSLSRIAYECRTCPNFALHTWCAILPKNVTHKFDPHPLHLITGSNADTNKQNNNGTVYDDICEICEHGIDNKVWYYGCEICNQSFHVDCIPCLDFMYKIKSLLSAGIILDDVPTRLIRGLPLQGRGHDYCTDVADEYDDILVSDEY